MRKPDFIIVGAPRCGSTALHNYLHQHPDIYMPRGEIHYFGSDLTPRPFSWIKMPTDEEYIALFSERRESLVGERSCGYLYSELAASEIKAYAPDTKIIISVRNPIDMVYSMHSQFVWNGNENVKNFEEAWEVEETRLRGPKLIRDGEIVKTHLYKTMAKYSPRIENFTNEFGWENVHVIIYDELKSDTPGTYRGLIRFLGADEDFEPEFKVINPSKRRRTHLQTRLKIASPQYVKQIVRAALPRSVRQAIWRGLSRVNTINEPLEPLAPQTRKKLRDEFAPDIDELGRLLDRDLSHWLENGASQAPMTE